MSQIPTDKPIFVSGANGFVASWLVKKLLENGFTVNAAVRNPNDENKVAHLKKLAQNSKGELKLFQADLLDPGSYDEAMHECELVYHTASPFRLDYEDPMKELVQPAVQGTQNILDSVENTPSVKRVVLTSSCAAIYCDAIDCANAPGGILTESDWDTRASLDYQPYFYSKTQAEKTAWESCKAQNRWDMVVINPSLVIGPSLNPLHTTSESFKMLTQLGDGTYKSGVPKMGMGVVDVRDVAEAHYLAGMTPEAQGRYITSAHNTDFLEMALSLKPKYGNLYPIPSRAIPKWLVMILGPMMDQRISRKMLKNNVNIPFRVDNSKIREELNIQFRDLDTIMNDGFQSLIDAGVL